MQTISSGLRQIQPVYHSSLQNHRTSSSNEQGQDGFQPIGVPTTSLIPTFLEFAGRQPRIIPKFDDQVASIPLDPLGHFQHQATQINSTTGLQFWPNSSTLEFSQNIDSKLVSTIPSTTQNSGLDKSFY